MEAYVLDWLNLLLRWLHLITGAAWIGASFYFVLLDNSLRPPASEEDIKRGVHGDYWAVHGGGFYHSQKYLTGPKGEPLTLDLHWSKWEAYTTWLSGMGLMAIVYWYGAGTYLIDRNVLALAPAVAIGISIASIIGGKVLAPLCCMLGGHGGCGDSILAQEFGRDPLHELGEKLRLGQGHEVRMAMRIDEAGGHHRSCRGNLPFGLPPSHLPHPDDPVPFEAHVSLPAGLPASIDDCTAYNSQVKNDGPPRMLQLPTLNSQLTD